MRIYLEKIFIKIRKLFRNSIKNPDINLNNQSY